MLHHRTVHYLAPVRNHHRILARRNDSFMAPLDHFLLISTDSLNQWLLTMVDVV